MDISKQTIAALILSAIEKSSTIGYGFHCEVVGLGDKDTELGNFLIRYPKIAKDHLISMLRDVVDGKDSSGQLSLPEFLFVGDNVSQALLQIVLPHQDNDRPILEVVMRQPGRDLVSYTGINENTGEELSANEVFAKKVALMKALGGVQSASLKACIWKTAFIASQRHSKSSPDFNDRSFIIDDNLSMSMVDIVGAEGIERSGPPNPMDIKIELMRAKLETLGGSGKISLSAPFKASYRAVANAQKLWQKALIAVGLPLLLPMSYAVRAVSRRQIRSEILDAEEQSRSPEMLAKIEAEQRKKHTEYFRTYNNVGFLDAVREHIDTDIPSALIQPYALELKECFVKNMTISDAAEVNRLYEEFLVAPKKQQSLDDFYHQSLALAKSGLTRVSPKEIDSILVDTKYCVYQNARASFHNVINSTLAEAFSCISDGTFLDKVKVNYPDWLGFQRGVVKEAGGTKTIDLVDATDLSAAEMSSGAVKARRINMISMQSGVSELVTTLRLVQRLAIPSSMTAYSPAHRAGANTQATLIL